MPAPPKAIAMDLDGTLMRADLSISPYSLRVLGRASAAGIHLAVVTGRPPRWLAAHREGLAFADVLIAANGAMSLDPRTGTILSHHPMTAPQAVAVVDRLRAALPDLAFAFEQGLDFAREAGYRPSVVGMPAVHRVGDARLLAAAGATKVLARHPELAAEDVAAIARPRLAGLAELCYSTHALIELSAPGVDKASALAAWCADLGVEARDVAAFGDMPNDLPMLRWAGRGVAMANGHPAVRAGVSGRAPAHGEDGVARTIEAWLDGRPAG